MMNRKLFVSSALTLMLGAAPALFAAEGDNPPPPPAQGCPMMEGGMGGNGMMGGKGGKGMQQRKPMMNPEDMAKFKEMETNIQTARKAYMENRSDENLGKLKTAVTAMVETRQKMELDRAQKMLDRAKAMQEKKSEIVDQMVKRMTQPKGKKHKAPKDAPAPAEVAK